MLKDRLIRAGVAIGLGIGAVGCGRTSEPQPINPVPDLISQCDLDPSKTATVIYNFPAGGDIELRVPGDDEAFVSGQVFSPGSVLWVADAGVMNPKEQSTGGYATVVDAPQGSFTLENYSSDGTNTVVVFTKDCSEPSAPESKR